MSPGAPPHNRGGAPSSVLSDGPSGGPTVAAYWSLYGTRLAIMAIGFLVGILSARGLGPSGRGVYATTFTAAALVVQCANVGLSSAILYFVSRRPRRSGAFLVLAWASGLGLLALCLPGYAALHGAGIIPAEALLVALWAPLQLTGMLQDQVVLGLKRFRLYTGVQLGGRCLALAAAAGALWLRPADSFAFVASQLMSDGAALLGGSVLLLFTGLGSPFRRVAIAPVARLACRAAPVLILPFVLVRSDILLVHFFRGAAETGVYSVAVQCIDLVALLPGTFATVLFVSLAHSRDRARMTARAARYVLVVLSLLAALLALAGPWVLGLLFGRTFEAAYGPLLVRLPGAVALGVQTIIVQYFNTQAYPWFLTRYWLIGLGLSLGINLYAIPRFGVMGAAAAGTVASTTVACLVWRRFTRATGLSLRSRWTG